MVILVPGMGDDVQAIKAGIIEIADVFVINKSDLPGAEKLERELNSYLGLSHRPDGWTPKIVHTVASEGKGIGAALEAAREYYAQNAGKSHTAEIWSRRLREMLRERLLDRLPEEEFSAAGLDVAEKRRDPYSIINEWLERL
jgi:LAO/AO transport system kinase